MDDFFTSIRWIPCLNTSGLTIPAFGCLSADGMSVDGIQQVIRCFVNSSRRLLFAGPTDIPAGKFGICTRDLPYPVLYDPLDILGAPVTPANGQFWGSQAGSFKLVSYQTGYRIEGNPTLGRVWVNKCCCTPSDFSFPGGGLYGYYSGGLGGAAGGSRYRVHLPIDCGCEPLGYWSNLFWTPNWSGFPPYYPIPISYDSTYTGFGAGVGGGWVGSGNFEPCPGVDVTIYVAWHPCTGFATSCVSIDAIFGPGCGNSAPSFMSCDPFIQILGTGPYFWNCDCIPFFDFPCGFSHPCNVSGCFEQAGTTAVTEDAP